jgi:hypothetical protein
MNQEKDRATGERRRYVRYTCRTTLKTIIDFNLDVARRTKKKVPHVVFHRGEEGTVRNISEKGISIELDHLLPESVMLKMSIENAIAPPIETSARVMWARKSPDQEGKYIMGLAFKYMREKHRRNLAQLIEFLKTIPE